MIERDCKRLLLSRRSALAAGALALLGDISTAAPEAPATPSAAAQGPQARRMALVIGNGRYVLTPLANPRKDAKLVAGTLRKPEFGFQVEEHHDLNYEQMRQVIQDWLFDAEPADVRVVYFSGHGAAVRGRNFLLPVNIKLRSEDDLFSNAFHADTLVDQLSRFGRGINIVVFEACRSIPSNMLQPGTHPKEIDPFGMPRGSPRGTLVAYSTSPGALAADTPSRSNSLFTRNLVKNMSTPGLPIEMVLRKTREAVMQASRGTQIPREDNGLVGTNFCFLLDDAGKCP